MQETEQNIAKIVAFVEAHMDKPGAEIAREAVASVSEHVRKIKEAVDAR